MVSKKLASPIAFRQPLEGGWELLFELTLSDRMEVRTRLLRHGRIATKREEELWRDTTPFVGAVLVKGTLRRAGEGRKENPDLINSGREKHDERIGRFLVDFHRWQPKHARHDRSLASTPA